MSEYDPEFFAALYKRHREKLLRVAILALAPWRCESEAQDVVNDAFLSLMRSHPSVVENWEALLVQTVKWRAIDHGRKNRRVAPDSEVVEGDAESEIDFIDDLIESVDFSREFGTISRALDELDDRTRFVVKEISMKGRSHAEVAEELGVSRPRISQIHGVGLKRLGEELRRKEVKQHER